MDLFLLHCLLLLWASLLTAQRLVPATADRLLAAGLVAWGNLVTTSLLLSLFHLLGERGWFLGVSVTLAVAACLAGRKIPAESAAPADGDAGTRPSLWLVGAFLLTLAPVAIASAAAAFHYAPNQADALTYQLPRVMYYLGQGSLGHFAAADPRQIYLPFNYNLVQLLGLIYSPPLPVLNLFNLAAWALGGLAAFRLCRACAGSANASLVACWFVLMLPPLLAQAASTTPDLAVGAALCCTLLFARRWQQTGRSRDATLAGLAAGLAAGSDLRALALVAAGGLVALAVMWRRERESNRLVLRTWLAPGLLAAGIGLPFALINLVGRDPTAISSLWSAPHRLATLQKWFLPAGPLNEDNAGLGLAGGLVLLAALGWLVRERKAAGAWWGLGWILIALLLPPWSAASPRDLVPALMLCSPGLAMTLDFLRFRPAALRLTGGAILLIVALVTGRSAGTYLLDNAARPFARLLHGTSPPKARAPAPLQVEYHLVQQARVNVETDGTDEPIFSLMGLRPDQRFTSRREPGLDTYNLISRSSRSRNSGVAELGAHSVYVMVPVEGKATAGVEFLATIGHGDDARDYFGLAADANHTPPVTGNCAVLVTIATARAAVAPRAQTRIRLAGLNPRDNARLQIDLKLADDTVEPLTTLTAGGEISVALTRPFAWLILRVVDGASGRELGAAAVPYETLLVAEQPIDPNQPSGPGSVFAIDLVLARQTSIITEGLTPVEGPFRKWDLPFIRWARAPVVRLRIPSDPAIARLQLSFSVRTHVRSKAVLELFFNGVRVRRFMLEGRTTWLEQTLLLIPQPGENLLEFRDASGESQPDWLDYLARYPDVKADLIARHLPFEQGAREHFEAHGRSEGRTVVMSSQPEVVPDSFYFLFRHLRLEGFSPP